MIDIYPNGFLFLQVFHALQYLIFPLRVELNQRAAIGIRVAVSLDVRCEPTAIDTPRG